MTTDRLTEVLRQTLKAVGIPGVRCTPTMVARHLGVPIEQARIACRRLAREGKLVRGRLVA